MNNEKLLCLMTLDDNISQLVRGVLIPGYWRAFIVEDRKTGEVSGLMRFKHEDGERNWSRMSPRNNKFGEQARDELCNALKTTIEISNNLLSLSDFEVQCFYPPDDQDDPKRTIDWLLERDLIEVQVSKTAGGIN